MRQTWLAAAVGLLVIRGSCTGESSAVRKQDEGPSAAVVRGQPRRCVADGSRPEREVISQFFEAYNRGDAAGVRRLADVTELWDPAGAPHHNTLRPDVGFWVASGQRVRDRFEIVELCVYPQEGADGTLVRQNDHLRDAGLAPLRQGVKIAMERGVIRRLVIYMPTGEDKARFCTTFKEAIRDAEEVEHPPQPQCG